MMVLLRAPLTSNGYRLLAASTSPTPPMLMVEAPSMKPEPCRLNNPSSPGRPPSMPASVGTTCSRMPALARKVCAEFTSAKLASVSRSRLTPSTLTSIRSGPALGLLPSQLSSTSKSKLRV